MIDRRRIVRAWREGTGKVLVTIVRIEGSSYRLPGARLLIAADGSSTGTISGGCLEAEVTRKAAWKVRGGAVVETYSTLFDDTAEIPFGLGCGGIVDLLFEPVETPEAAALLESLERSLKGEEFTVATWLPESGRPLRRGVIDAAGQPVFASAGLEVSALTSVASSKEIFHERLRGPQRLIVFGAGEDARPVVTMASLLGWSVTVVDGRPQLARADRFPEAERVGSVASVGELRLSARDAAVLMTHSYEQDRAWLGGLLAGMRSGDETAMPGYIGLLGARHRSSLLVSEVAAHLGTTVEACCARVWAPVGLDLGGDGPEAIALAVIAEVQAWVQGRLARSRRLTAADVAEQIAKNGSSIYLQGHCPADLVH